VKKLQLTLTTWRRRRPTSVHLPMKLYLTYFALRYMKFAKFISPDVLVSSENETKCLGGRYRSEKR